MKALVVTVQDDKASLKWHGKWSRIEQLGLLEMLRLGLHHPHTFALNVHLDHDGYDESTGEVVEEAEDFWFVEKIKDDQT